MAKIEKKQILLSFDDEAFLEFRKSLFRNGMSVQDFFSHIITIINNKDEDCDFIFKKVKATKKESILTGKEEIIKEDLLYEMFEEKLK